MNSKAQVTLFIIIGLIIVASVGMFIFYKSKIMPQVEPQYTLSAKDPLRLHVERCITDTAYKAVKILGEQSGYIYLPERVQNDPYSYLAFGPEFFQQRIPYWWYKGYGNVPSIKEIESQIARYVNQNIPVCLNNFSALETTYDVEAKGNPVAKVNLNENNIGIRMTYPLTIIDSTNNTKNKVSEFSASLPIRLKKIYELAKAIMDQENKDSFIEEKTIDLMALDNDRDIPLIGMDVSCDNKVWKLADVKHRLKELLQANLQYVRVKGTEYNEESFFNISKTCKKHPENCTYEDSYYGYHYVWEVADDLQSDMVVSFNYDEKWDLKLSARPSDGTKLESNAQKGYDMLKYFCLHLWHFNYDIEFPVTVKISDLTGREAYHFTFAFTTSIDHNEPRRENFPRTAFAPRSSESNNEYCNDKYYNITIYAKDSKTDDAIGDVNLTFNCGPYHCDMGSTEVFDYVTAYMKAEFPLCSSGIIKGVKEGYLEGSAFISTDKKDSYYDLMLQPVKYIKNYTVVKHTYRNDVIGEYADKLDKAETVTIMMKESETGYESFGVYSTNMSGISYPLTFMAKDDYVYNITVYLMKDGNITGGYSTRWEVPWDDIKDADEIEFHVIDKGQSSMEDMFEFINDLEETSDRLPEPEIR